MGKTRSQRWRKANATRRKLSDKRGFDAKTKLKFKKRQLYNKQPDSLCSYNNRVCMYQITLKYIKQK